MKLSVVNPNDMKLNTNRLTLVYLDVQYHLTITLNV